MKSDTKTTSSVPVGACCGDSDHVNSRHVAPSSGSSPSRGWKLNALGTV